MASSSLVAKPLINSLKENDSHELIGIVTNPDKPKGRGQNIEPNPLANWVTSEKLTVFKPADEIDLMKIIEDLHPDLVITIAFGRIVSKQLLNRPKYGWINVHFSLLPKWRGAAPVQWSILSGEKKSGISIFKLDEGMDTGPIYVSGEFDMGDDETSEQVLKVLSIEAVEKVNESLNQISKNFTPRQQGSEGISYAKKFSKNDGRIKWNSNATVIYNLFRAIGHDPGIWCMFGESRVRLNSIMISDSKEILNPGEITIMYERLFVGTMLGKIEVLELTPAGRSRMSAAEFVRGLTNRTGLFFG